EPRASWRSVAPFQPRRQGLARGGRRWLCNLLIGFVFAKVSDAHEILCLSVVRSPDRAKRYPGTVAQLARSFPDFADAQSGLQSWRSSGLRNDGSKNISAPVCGSGPGFALIRLFRLPRHRGGWRADKAQCPDYSGRIVRIAPDDGA